MQTHRHQADILIIGGGVCGLNAALTAREQGRSVIVMDKAVIERSGHIAGGIDHFLAYMDTGAEWDTREAYLEFTGKSARGVTNIDVVDSPTRSSVSKKSTAPSASPTAPITAPSPTGSPARGGSTSTARG